MPASRPQAFQALAHARHQHPLITTSEIKISDADRRRLYRACGADSAFDIRTRQDLRPGGADRRRPLRRQQEDRLATTRGSLAGPAMLLLRRLREIMAEPISAQERLDKIVTQIAANMVAEVCSVYVLRADNVLELYATEGLKRERRAPRHADGRPRPGRPDRRRGAAAQPARRAVASRLRLPAGDRRGDLPLLPRRADPARRPHARRPRRPEPLVPHLHRRGDRGAADDGDGARRDVRVRASSRTWRCPAPISTSTVRCI